MEKEVKHRKRRFTLVYRRSGKYGCDPREYNTNRYTPHFLDVIASRCKPEKDVLGGIVRVKSNEGWFYGYCPSPSYHKFRKKLNERKIKLLTANQKRKEREEKAIRHFKNLLCTLQGSLSPQFMGEIINKGKR
jgi:hypothetical protein